MPYALIDDEICDHPKFAEVGLDAIGLWTLGLSWCSRHLTDGHIPTRIVERYTAGARRKTTVIAAELVQVGLWEPTDGGWLYHDFHDHNPSGEEVREKRSKVSAIRSAAGRKGAAKRWGTGSNGDGKRDGKPIANGTANAEANGSQSDNPVPVPVAKELTGDAEPKSYAVPLANDPGPILLVPDVDPTAQGLCPTCGCDRSRAGTHVIDGIDVVCTHPDTENPGPSST